MKKIKKLGLIIFVMFVMINLKLNTPLTEGMQEGFSLTQLVDNIFVPSAIAEEGGYYCSAYLVCNSGNTIDCSVSGCNWHAGCFSLESQQKVVCNCDGQETEVYCTIELNNHRI